MKMTVDIIFDYAFLGVEGDRDTVPTRVICGRRTNMMVAHVLPKKGRWSTSMVPKNFLKDIHKLGCREIILSAAEGQRETQRPGRGEASQRGHKHNSGFGGRSGQQSC